MIPTYVLNADWAAVIIITREIDERRVEIMWIVAPDPKRVGTCDWAFRSNMDNGKSWTRIA